MLQKWRGRPSGGRASSAADVSPHLRQKQFVWRGCLRIPALLLNSGWRFIAAQQLGLMGEGRRRKAEEKRERGGEAVGPALPALGPALASNCNSSSGGTVSSAWLPLTSPPLPASSPVAPAWIQKPPLSSVFSLILSPVPDLKTIRCFSVRSLCLCFCAPPVLSGVFPPPNDESLRLHGVNM